MEEKEATREPSEDAPAPAPPPVPPPVDPPPIAHGSTPEGDKKREKMSTSDLVMSIATIFIALGTIVSAVAIFLQWREMVNGGEDTTAIKVAAQKQSDAAQKFADTAVLINGNISDAVRKLDAQAKATQAATSASIDALMCPKEHMSRWMGRSLMICN